MDYRIDHLDKQEIRMLLVPSNGSGTVKPDADSIRMLLDCADITTFREAGWFCAVGWRESNSGVGRDKVIGIHFDSERHYLQATGQLPEEECSYDRRRYGS